MGVKKISMKVEVALKLFKEQKGLEIEWDKKEGKRRKVLIE